MTDSMRSLLVQAVLGQQQQPQGWAWLSEWVTRAPLVTSLVAAVALVISLFNLWLGRRDRRRDRRVSVIDQYWFRVVLGPLCIEPLMQFVLATTKAIRELHEEHHQETNQDPRPAYTTFLATARADKADLIIRVRLLAVLDTTLYAFVAKELDSIEDTLVKHCSARSMNLGDGGPDADYAKTSDAIMGIVTGLGTRLVKAQGAIK